MRDLTKEERAVVEKLGEAARLFAQLNPSHSGDLPEFVAGIHALQNIVLARPATEVIQAEITKRK